MKKQKEVVFDSFSEELRFEITKQTKAIKEHISKILDENGNVRPGVTGSQVRKATATVREIQKHYDKSNSLLNDVLEDYKQLNKQKKDLRKKFKEQGIEHIIKRMPFVSILMGY